MKLGRGGEEGNWLILSLSLWAIGLYSLDCQPVLGEEILVLLPMASKSHKSVFIPLVHALGERGHQVTFVSPFKPAKSTKNVNEIQPTTYYATLFSSFGNPFVRRSESMISLIVGSAPFIIDGCEDAYSSQELLGLMRNNYSLILMDAYMNDCLAGMLYRMKVPFILVVPLAAPSSITQYTGNRLPPSVTPSPMFPFEDRMTFSQRVQNFCITLFMELFDIFSLMPSQERIYRRVLGDDIPGIVDVFGNVSMIFSNSHHTLTFPRATLPDVVEVGGMHCVPAKPLPKELEEFVNGAKDGVIFFSLGSIIQGSQMPENVRKIFVNVFSRLKQRVLWKWETEEMSDLPKNVKLGKWLPQQDILGHKNTKMFLTHGGMMSTQEATYHGVPLIGFPIMGDQDLNMKQAERSGYAISLEILDITEEKLERAINDILTKKQYTVRAKRLSKLFRDQTETPLERAVYWSEYVMRHKGAQHLRSAARKLNFFQYHSIDVIVVLAVTLLLVLWVVKVVICKLQLLLELLLYCLVKLNLRKRSDRKRIK